MPITINIRNAGKYFERTNTLVDYYNDVKNFDKTTTITADDEAALFDVIKHGTKKESQKARNLIIMANQRFVISVAKTFATNNNLLDLINEGNIGLMDAIDAYNTDVKVDGKNVKFITFAVHYIRRAINQYKVNNDAIIRKSNVSKTYYVVSRARNKFLQDNGRQPTADELKDTMNKMYGVNIKKASDVIDMKISYIDESLSDDDDDATMGDMALFNSYSATGNDYEKSVSNEYNKELVTSILNILTPREQSIIKMAFGIGVSRPMTCIEIGEKVHLTPERVRQMRLSIMKRLQKEVKKKINKDI